MLKNVICKYFKTIKFTICELFKRELQIDNCKLHSKPTNYLSLRIVC